MQQASTISHQPESQTPGNPTPGGVKPAKKEGWRSVVSTILILAAAPVIAIVLTAFVFQSYEVDGPSMETTLQNHDRLIVNKIPRSLARLGAKPYVPARGTIIVFHKTGLPLSGHSDQDFVGGDKQLIKRVIGIPGDRVIVKDNQVIIYNAENPGGFNPDAAGGYGNAARLTPGNVDITVRENEVFVMGDNRTNSLDSRSFGTVSSDEIVGKLVFRFFPFNKADSY